MGAQFEIAHETARLSPSIARDLLDCPIRAWQRHRLFGNQSTPETAAQREGKILERLIVGAFDDIAVVHAEDWRSKEARAQRAEAIDNENIPVLVDEYRKFLGISECIAHKINERCEGFAEGIDQHRFEWESNGVPCSGVLDRLRIDDDSYTIWDLKKVRSAHPEYIAKAIAQYSYDMQAAAYVEAVETTFPHLAGRGQFYFVCYETAAPFCVTVAQLSGDFAYNGAKKWERAKRMWKTCIATDDWPEYASAVVTVEPKPWMLDATEDGDEDMGGI